MVRRQAGRVPQLWLAGGQSECPWASVVSRTNCTSEPRRQRCARDSETPRPNSRKPMRVPTRCRAIARLCGAWGVLPWRWRYAAMRPKRRNWPRRLRSSFQTEPSGMRCSFPRFARRSRSIAINLPRAVELLASASPYERSYLDAVYLRGLAYLRLHKGAEAAAEFQKIVDHKGANWASCLALPLLGTVLFALLSGGGARLCARGRHGESQKGVPGLLRIVEGRRPGHPDSSARSEAEYAELPE